LDAPCHSKKLYRYLTLAQVLTRAIQRLHSVCQENPADDKVSTSERWSAMQGAQSNLRGHRAGLAYLSALLENAKSEIASDGYMSERVGKIFF
jgi:hypothetical protein